MRLVLRHVEKTKAGGWQYRRRVPKAVCGIITKREFKQKLGETEREALAAYSRYHAQVEREISAAQGRIAQGEAVRQGTATDREAYAEALRRRADLISAGATEEELAHEGDSIAESYPQNGRYEPTGAPLVDQHSINLLRLGPERYAPPAATLTDALNLYLKERVGDILDNRPADLTRRVINAVVEALGRDPVVSSLTREDARKVRDEMLDRVKVRGRGVGGKVSASTVSRELTIIAAVINYAKVELGLPETFVNPFSKLPVARVAKGTGTRAADKRDPLPPDVLKGVRQQVVRAAGADLARIWRLLEGTGCRVAEVTGLLVSDVDIAGEFPFIRIEANHLRSLKTESSRRVVPLVGDALEAAKEAIQDAQEGGPLFPAYGRARGSDAASASLMKHMRRITDDPKHVLHSLRHNMKDRLMLAEVSSLDQNLILGHALGGVGDRVYGGDAAKLRVTTKAMQKALALP